MGFIMDEVGNISIEVRRESFIVHHETQEHYEGCAPEYDLSDLGNLMAALEQARFYIDSHPTKPTDEA